MNSLSTAIRFIIAVTVIVISSLLWFKGAMDSPLFSPQRLQERDFISNYISNNSPDYQQERLLAKAYWLRYRDVKEDSHWGMKGPKGIWGPRDHYRVHGKREGRIFQPLPEYKDPEKEKQLAEAYWKRYSTIEKSTIWGRHSQLGFRGPRDHYTYFGKREGKVWGVL